MSKVKVVVYELEYRGLLAPPTSIIPLRETLIYARTLASADIDDVVAAVNRIGRDVVGE